MENHTEVENAKGYETNNETVPSSVIYSSLGESYEFGNKEEEVKRRLHEISMNIGIKMSRQKKCGIYSEEGNRRKKKYVPFELNFLKEMGAKEIYDDLEKIRNIMGGSDFKIKIENKVLRTLQGNFKKNDRVRLVYDDKEVIAVISWINTTEVTFRGKEGERIKHSVNDFISNKVKIYKVRRSFD